MADSSSPDVSGMVNDPQFLGLPPEQKRAALVSLTGDQTFNQLSDADTMQFVSRVASPRTALTRPDVVQPPAVQRPQVQMQESLLAPSAVASQPDKELTSLSQSGEGYASDEGTSAAMSAAGVGTLASLIGARGCSGDGRNSIRAVSTCESRRGCRTRRRNEYGLRHRKEAWLVGWS